MIDFKTYDEQLQILKERGLIINNESLAKQFLTVNNYYNVINAYKSLFIKTDVTPEKYIEGASFDEIISLHKFDKDLRIIFSNIIIKIERTIKSIIAHELSKKCPNHDCDYLNIDFYDTSIIMDKNAVQPVTLASEVIRVLNNELTSAIDHNDEMICHYKNKYNKVPLWVFINKLSFGTISKMYNALKSTDKDCIAAKISRISNINISAKELSNAIKVLVYLRNKTAHDQIIYNFSSKPTTVSNKNKLLKTYNLTNVQSLFGAIACISLFFEQAEFDIFVKEIKNLIKKLFLNIHSIPTAKILNNMGIPPMFLS